MTDDAVRPCPNTKCKSECALFEGYSGWYYACKLCGYCSPYSESPEESLLLHNLICTPPAGWKLVPIELLNWWHEKADDIDDDCKTILPAFKGAESEGSILGIQAVAQQLRHSIAGIAAPENDDA